MKRVTFILMILLPLTTFGQLGLGNEIKMTTEFGSENQEIQDILFFEGIDYFKVRFVGDELKNKHFCLIVKDLWDGEITKIDTIINTDKIEGMPPIQSDAFKFKVTAKKFAENKLKVPFRFDRFGNERMYDATNSFDYSLRALGNRMEIVVGKPFPAFAYILPYEENGWKKWCAVESSGKDVENWGKEFGIKHYLIFEMMFE